MTSKKLIKNCFRCFTCGAVIESKSRHDLVSCNCPEDSDTRIFVDGGLLYSRFGYGIKAEYEDLSEWEDE